MMVYIIQEEIACEGGVGPILAVDAYAMMDTPMRSVVDAVDVVTKFEYFSAYSGPQEIDDENADDNYWFIEQKNCPAFRLGIKLVDVL